MQSAIPRTVREFELHSGIHRKYLLRISNIVSERYGLRVTYIEPSQLIIPFGSRIGFMPKTIALAQELATKIGSLAVGRNAATIAASLLYLASKQTQDQVTQRLIANKTGIIEVTLRRRTNELLRKIRGVKDANY